MSEGYALLEPNLQGGMKAVVWTDVFQTLIMYAGMLAILIKVGAALCTLPVPPAVFIVLHLAYFGILMSILIVVRSSLQILKPNLYLYFILYSHVMNQEATYKILSNLPSPLSNTLLESRPSLPFSFATKTSRLYESPCLVQSP